jgi:hypothetical protein
MFLFSTATVIVIVYSKWFTHYTMGGIATGYEVAVLGSIPTRET